MGAEDSLWCAAVTGDAGVMTRGTYRLCGEVGRRAWQRRLDELARGTGRRLFGDIGSRPLTDAQAVAQVMNGRHPWT